jgi:predicted ester cyclase
VVEGDLVTTQVTFRGTHQGEFLGVAPTGKPMTFSIIDIWRVQNGKITELWHNVPVADILEQIGGPPAQ